MDVAGVASPIEHEDRLQPRFERPPKRELEARAERVDARRLIDALAALVGHVHDLDARQDAPADALGHFEQREARARSRRVVPRFEAGRRRAQHDWATGDLPAPQRDVSRVVAWELLLLEARVVLLVHDDETEPGRLGLFAAVEGREDGRPRPDDHPRLALGDPRPLLMPLRGGQTRMKHRDGLGPEAPDEPPGRLGRQADLGHQEDRPLPALENPVDRPQVHLGLARTGDPIEKEGRETNPASRRSPRRPGPGGP